MHRGRTDLRENSIVAEPVVVKVHTPLHCCRVEYVQTRFGCTINVNVKTLGQSAQAFAVVAAKYGKLHSGSMQES